MNGPSTRVIVRTVAIVVIAVVILYLIYLLRQPLAWIFIAGFIAVALSGPVKVLEDRMRRGFAIALVYLTVILAPFLVAAIVIPPLVSELDKLIGRLPQYAADAQTFVAGNDRLQSLEQDYQVIERLQQEAQRLPAKIGDAAALLGNVGVGIVNSVFAMVTILILSVFLVSSGPGWVRALIELQPDGRRARLERTLDGIGSAVGNYVAGAVLQATVAGFLTFIVLSALGMPFAAPLAVIVALFDLIPLVGATLAAVLVGIVTVFNDFPTTTLIWAVWSVIYQQLENNVIQPQIQKRAVNVHPFVVLTAVLCGSALFGVLGALLAIPVAASLQIAVREWWQWRREYATQAPGDAVPRPPGTPPAPPSTAAS
jgi:predicted PurR-regulated permease PerM